MAQNTDNLLAANQAFFQSQLAAFRDLVGIATEETEKTFALNLAAGKATADESTSAIKDLLNANDPHAFLALASTYARLHTERVAGYQHHLTDIASATKAEIEKVAETRANEIRGAVGEFVNTIAKSAPAGTEIAIALLKASVEQTNAGYEKLSSATEQATGAMQQQFANIAQKTTKPTKVAPIK